MSENDIRWESIKSLKKYVSDKKTGSYEIKVGSWIINGRKLDPIIEKREFYIGHNGQEMMGKAKGLNKADMYLVLEHIVELSEIMGFPIPKEAMIPLDPPVKELLNPSIPPSKNF